MKKDITGATRINGLLWWDRSVSDHHGWLLSSEALLDGAACIPCPSWYGTPCRTSRDNLGKLVEATLEYEGKRILGGVTINKETL